ncbi:non-ribosomal peptide synthetase [Nocardia arthritidis]|uniref:Amino acid adenylation domain-containing protein n=1 Tax=Nocardia arthritidis TaxID=228602 RepID=A0A6G9YLT8_9NOCA|nr:non-ribosomal peptide synthetase [Nocardia arthritidis]QIS14174.1 amino acid adenylation domain-containing protein [Nocardia arthritidis]
MTNSRVAESDPVRHLSSTEKRRLLATLLRDRAQRRTPRWPLSYGQRALWFLHQLAPDATAYNLGEALVLHGPLDRVALRRAVAGLAQRHRVLCSRIVTDDHAEPHQEEIAAETLRISETDATGWGERELTAHLAAEVDRPFDLATGPLIRLGIYRTAPDEHVALLVVHHIVGEFWTLVLLVNDLAALYRAEIAGTEPVLAPMTRHYAEFTRWQSRMLAGPEGQRLWEHWRDKLTGPLPVLQLPTDRPRPQSKSFRGALHGFRIEARTADRVREFARATGATTYQTLLTVFAVFLHRHSNQHDLLIGTPMTGRTEAEWAPVAGYFDNALPLRVRLNPATTFADLVRQVRSTSVDALVHQALPFPMLVERLRIPRDLGRSPLFDVMFVLRQARSREMSGLTAMGMGGAGGEIALTPELTATSLELPRTVAQFDLTLSLAESADGMHGSWEYSTDLFDRSTVRRFTDRFTVLLDELLEAPERPIGAVPILPTAEYRRVVEDWNDTAGPLPTDIALHDGFRAMAAARPQAEAIIDDRIRLSYAELDEFSDTVAAWLQRAQARPGQLVAICMRKGWEQIAAALGVCKSGAAYLPVDAELPARRIAELLRLGGVDHVLVQPGTRAVIPAEFSGHVFDIDVPTLRATAATPRVLPADPHRLAYVIFTSGSTGTPKGVIIDHLGATNTIRDMNSRFAVDENDRVLALSSLSFDLSVYDIFGVLAAGGAIVVPRATGRKDPAHWLELTVRERVTMWNSVPALAGLVAEEAEHTSRDALGLPAPGRLRLPTIPLGSVRICLMSGDWIPLSLPDRLRALNPSMQVISLGGATEASIWSICYPVHLVDPQWTSIPYGRPMTNQRFHILNEAGYPCPPGVTGELHIGGVGVALGYWRDTERTEERFITHPEFGRLYRTGDLGRYHPDGLIEFLGRSDQQVKIGGYRIELGEIEAVLREHGAIRDAVVLAIGGHLVGYIVVDTEGHAGTEVAELADRHCRAVLPAYMVPPEIIAVERFPLSSNGKVDRNALAAMAAGHGGADAAGPTDERQTLLCGLLAELLDRPDIGIGADFFALGGDSVLAIRLSAAARRAGLLLTPEQIFAHRTVLGMASVSTPAEPDPGAHWDAETARSQQFSPMQQTMLMHCVTQESPQLYCEQIRLRLSGPVQVDALRTAWQHVLDRHETLRMRFGFDSLGRPVQQVGAADDVTIAVVDLRELDPDEGERQLTQLLENDREQGFPDLAGPLLMRWTLVQRCAEHFELIWTHHHLLLDGWSLGTVLREVMSCYRAVFHGRPPTLVEPPRYSALLARHAAMCAERAAAQELFWRTELAGLTAPTRALPPDKPLQDSALRHGTRELRFTADETAAVRRGAIALGVTVNTIFQAAWALLLARWTGESDVVFGVTITGRSAELDGMESAVGLFINTLPLRVPVDPAVLVATWLRSIQDRQLRISANDGLTLAQVERCSGLVRSVGEMTLFDTILVFENYPAAHDLDAEGTGLSITDVQFDEATGTPLMLYVIPETEMVLRATFAAALDEQHVHGILAQVRTAVLELLRGPDRRIDRIPSLPASERDRAVLNGGPLSVPARPVVDLILECARRQPTAIAVEHGTRQLTYQELELAAQQLACNVIRHGVRPDQLVAVLLPNGIEAVVAIVGVLLAGAGYLPMDPVGPRSRMEAILADAEPSVIITSSQYVDLVENRREDVILIDHAMSVDCAASVGSDFVSAFRPVSSAGTDDAAYAIYTSGSTGRPNGVLITRGALASFVAGARDSYRLTPDDRVLQFAPLHFDASVEEIFLTLVTGATLVVRTAQMLQSIPHFVDACARQRIGVLDLPTAFWHELTHALATGLAVLPDSVRMVIIGGEGALPERVVQWNNMTGGSVRLLNTYGPTEATVVATAADLNVAGIRGPGDTVPIGVPLPGVRAAVLDQHGQPAAPNAVGELYLIGAGLAREYVRQPELTSERFAPLTQLAGRPRAYRTGDLVRRGEDGRLVFVGRIDEQFKISGHRVDPAEIETLLLGHPGVAEAAVVGRVLADGAKHLSAHIVPAASAVCPSSAQLRRYLGSVLPAASIPGSVVMLEWLPRTASGKVDRGALRNSPLVTEATQSSGAAPTTELERAVLTVWEQVLGVRISSTTEDFFQLGGQSLQTIQAVNRIGAALGRDVPVALLFRHPTVAGLAAALDCEPGAAPRRITGLPPAALADAILTDDVVSSASAPVLPSPLRRVLLTGATGFVGAHLLTALLAQTDAQVVCLVRADDAAQGLARIQRALAGQRLSDDALNDRVVVLPADLTMPRLGLDDQQFTELSVSCDAIYHNAAVVDIGRTYSSLRAANVVATREILRLAAAHRSIPVHYVSTLSVAAPARIRPDVAEEFLPAHEDLWDGYPQTKWVSERLLQQAAERGLPVAVYRLGRVTGATGTGIINTKDLLWRMLLASIRTGTVPDLDASEVWTPVDFVGPAIVRLSLAEQPDGRVFNLAPVPAVNLADIFSGVREYGFPLTTRPITQWRDTLAADPTTDHTVLAFLDLRSDDADRALSFESLGTVHNANVVRGLAASTLRCTPIDRELLHRYLDHCIDTGLLPPP